VSESETSPLLPRLKRRPHASKGTIVLAILTIATVAWRVIDVWSNLEFLGEKAGLFWRVLHFFIATQAGANTLVIVFVALLVGSLLFQFERARPPEISDSQPPAILDSSAPLALTPVPQENTEKPNLVFKKPEHVFVHSKYLGVLQEGRNEDQYHFDPDMVGVVLPVENEFSDEFKVIPVSGVTAQLFYGRRGIDSFRVNRAAWLGGGNWTRFRVNDVQRLIVAVVVPGKGKESPLVVALYKEYEDSFNHLEKLVRILDEEYYRLRVKLISEELGIVYADKEFDLEITQDPVAVELVPLVRLSTYEIREKLEEFLDEYNQLLKAFPKDHERTDEDEKKIDMLERRIARFLRRFPERVSLPAFLSDVPVVKYSGVAHSSNWPSLNRLTTRIARLREMIDEARRG